MASIDVNKRPIEVCDIHKEINSLFNRSSFARLVKAFRSKSPTVS